MREITELKALSDYILFCRFENGISKNFYLKLFLSKEAFLPLKDENNFKKVINKNYFVEWEGLDIDLSADTLWHCGV
jgi:hypothetical protein